MPADASVENPQPAARETRFWQFFVALGCVFVASPVAGHLGLGVWVRAAFMIVLVQGAYFAGTTRRHLWTAVCLAVPAFLLQGAAISVDAPALDFGATSSTLVFLVYVTVVSTVRVLSPGAVTADRLVGSAVVYLLLGLVWSMLFALQEVLQPGSFAGLDRGVYQGDELLYFSFVTLTTLGYGDISPLTPITRTTVWLEAVVGQLYLAILVARLVGIPAVARARGEGGDR